jgi:hypothetical protein
MRFVHYRQTFGAEPAILPLAVIEDHGFKLVNVVNIIENFAGIDPQPVLFPEAFDEVAKAGTGLLDDYTGVSAPPEDSADRLLFSQWASFGPSKAKA